MNFAGKLKLRGYFKEQKIVNSLKKLDVLSILAYITKDEF